MLRRILLLIALAVALAPAATGCGGGGAKTASSQEAKVDLDADPIALLPGGNLTLGNFDARAFLQSGQLGGDVAKLVDQLVPLGDESGFVPSRDVDRIVLATYAAQGVDAAAIVTGRFDSDRVQLAAKNNTLTKSGTPLAASSYLGYAVYNVNNVEFAILTPRTVVAGSEAGVRRTLEKIKDGKVGRSVASWMSDTLETKGAAIAFVADFAKQPIATASIGAFNLNWLKGMKACRVVGNFADPGINVAATLTYTDPSQAASAADGIRTVKGWADVFSKFMRGIPELQNLEVNTDGADAKCKFALKQSDLQGVLGMLAAWIPKPIAQK